MTRRLAVLLVAGLSACRGTTRAAWDFPTSSGPPVREASRLADALATRAERAERLARGSPADALAQCAADWRLWVAARDDARGLALFEPLLTGAPANDTWALCAYGASLLAFRSGALERSTALAQAAAQAARSPEAKGLSRLALARVAVSRRDAEAARREAEAALATLAPLGEAWRQGPMHLVAQAFVLAGEWKGACVWLQQSLALNRALQDRGMVIVELHNLGHAEAELGDAVAAASHFAELDALEGPPRDAFSRAMRSLNAAVLDALNDKPGAARQHLANAQRELELGHVTLEGDDELTFQRWRRRITAD